MLVSRRFSVRSRSLRRIRFFCEAMLAMSHVPEWAPSPLGRPPTIAIETSLETPKAPDSPDRDAEALAGRRRARGGGLRAGRGTGRKPGAGPPGGPHRPLDRVLLVATAASRIAGLVPRDRRRQLLRHLRADVGLHDRLPGPQPGPRPLRRRGPAAGLRADLHRAAGAQELPRGVPPRLDPAAARHPRARRDHGALRPRSRR